MTPLALRMRSSRFEADLDRLRPLGEAYVMRRFGGSLNRADAEDAVSDVVIRLHRCHERGNPPRNLRAAFFTSVRNAAVDQLRARGVRPTVALEAAADAPAEDAVPAEHAEEREDAAVIREALARTRPNYRQAIVLRFGLSMTVPEIAEHLGLSLPAAKKLVLRATRQLRDRVESIAGAEHCPDAREFARRALLEKQVAGLASDEEADLVRRHLEHCGGCKSFISELHRSAHELGSAGLFATAATDQLTGKAGIADHVSRWIAGAGEGTQAATEKARLGVFKLQSALPGGAEPGIGGALAGGGQKVLAACTATAAATCLATGVVGPGVALDSPPGADGRPSNSASAEADPQPGVPNPAEQEAQATVDPTTPSAAPTPAQQVTRSVGFERPAPVASSSNGGGGGEFGGPAPSGSSSSGGSASGGGFGFEQ